MRAFATLAAIAAVTLAGCAGQQDLNDPLGWGRIDCRRAVDDPALSTKFEQDKLVCAAKAEATAEVSRSQYGYQPSLVGALSAGVQADRVGAAAARACMAEAGYVYIARSAHEARCAKPASTPATPPKRERRSFTGP